MNRRTFLRQLFTAAAALAVAPAFLHPVNPRLNPEPVKLGPKRDIPCGISKEVAKEFCRTNPYARLIVNGDFGDRIYWTFDQNPLRFDTAS